MPLVSAMLTKEEHEALQSVPGLSDKQRLKWLVRFWSACRSEKEVREANEKEAAAKAERAKLHVAGEGDEPERFRGKVMIPSQTPVVEAIEKASAKIIAAAGTSTPRIVTNEEFKHNDGDGRNSGDWFTDTR